MASCRRSFLGLPSATSRVTIGAALSREVAFCASSLRTLSVRTSRQTRDVKTRSNKRARSHSYRNWLRPRNWHGQRSGRLGWAAPVGDRSAQHTIAYPSLEPGWSRNKSFQHPNFFSEYVSTISSSLLVYAYTIPGHGGLRRAPLTPAATSIPNHFKPLIYPLF